jgi:hypothetical protein
MRITWAIAMVAITVFCQHSLAHGGGTDLYGCHNNSKTGMYECHSGVFAGQVFSSKNAMLAKLGSSGGAPTNGASSSYSRDDYLPSWADLDNDCRDTRAEVLISESLTPVTFDNKGCAVISGLWHDPYTGLTFTNPSDLDVDHLVPLKEAHLSGGYLWSAAQKRAYANDVNNPLVLIAVDDSTNQSKGDRDPALWLPPSASYRCEYIKSWVIVKKSYGLSIDAAEQAAIDAIMPSPNQPTRIAAPASWSILKSSVEAGAVFSLGLTASSGCGYQNSAKSTESIAISAEIAPAPDHIGQVGNLYVVVSVGGSTFVQRQDGSFVSWDGEIRSLEAAKDRVALKPSMIIDIFKGKLGILGQFQFFVGYSTASGELIYSPSPIQITIAN